MRQAGLTPRRDLDPRFISSPGGGNRPNDVRPRLQDISRIVDPAAVHVPADGAINRHRGSPEGDRGIARVSPRRDLVAVAPGVVVLDGAARPPHEQYRTVGIELEVDALGPVAELDGRAPDDFDLRVGLQKARFAVGAGRRPRKRNGAVHAEGERVRFLELAAIHRGKVAAHRDPVRGRRIQWGRRREPQRDRVAPFDAAWDRGCNAEDPLGIDRRVEGTGDWAVERDGDDAGGGGRVAIGWCDPEDTQRCGTGHGEAGDCERNDGGERAHKAFAVGFIIRKSKKGTSQWRPVPFFSERATGFEPVTSSLGSWHSTPELRPRRYGYLSYTRRPAIYRCGDDSGDRTQPGQPLTQLSSVLLDAVLHNLGAMPHLTEMPVHAPHHRLAAAPHLPGHRVDAHGRPGVERHCWTGASSFLVRMRRLIWALGPKLRSQLHSPVARSACRVCETCARSHWVRLSATTRRNPRSGGLPFLTVLTGNSGR